MNNQQTTKFLKLYIKTPRLKDRLLFNSGWKMHKKYNKLHPHQSNYPQKVSKDVSILHSIIVIGET